MSTPSVLSRVLRRVATPAGILGAGALFGALGFCVFSGHYLKVGYQQCHPPRSAVTAEETERAQRLLPGLRELTYQTADSLTLRSWYAPPKNGSVMVIVTGLGGNRASLLDEAALFARHGYGVLLLDARAHGDSQGNTATWGYLEADDVVRAVDLAYAQPNVEKVGALGFSVGGSAVALAAIRSPKIRVVVLYATWTSLREELAYKAPSGRLSEFWIRKGYELSGVNIDAVAPGPEMHRLAPRPLFMLSGSDDTDTPPDEMDRLFALCAEPKELWHLSGVGHGGYFQAQPEEYERRVVGFLDRAFGAAAR